MSIEFDPNIHLDINNDIKKLQNISDINEEVIKLKLEQIKKDLDKEK